MSNTIALPIVSGPGYIFTAVGLHSGCLHWHGVSGAFLPSAHGVLQCFLPLAV